MAVVQVSVVPVGTAGPSISRHVAHCIDVLEETELTYKLTPMGTVIEGDLRDVLDAIASMHEQTFGDDVARVLTTVIVDDRKDKPLTMSGKLDAVHKRRADR
ncbi:MAG: MTH1187 family thiamine-binding protein [Candidatus Eisenbacteria bacterium]|nr:MTH1187 family thiamine-binding protein [Candidatus Eisenbacteria bacterium]